MHAMQDEAGAPLIAAHEETTQPTSTPASRARLFALLAAAAAAVLVADQLAKWWALQTLTPGEPVAVFGSLITFNLIRNPGAAFSIGNGATWVLTLIACGVLVFIVVTARRIGSAAWAWALGLLLGGALGNLADIAIVGAAMEIAVLAMRGSGVDGRRPEHGRHEAPRHEATPHEATPHEATRHEATRHEATRHEAEPNG